MGAKPTRITRVSSADDLVVGRYDSLDALFSALDGRKPPLLAITGCVRVHPTLFWGKRLADYSAVRKRLEAYGLRLLITSAVEPYGAELRRYDAASNEPALAGR